MQIYQQVLCQTSDSLSVQRGVKKSWAHLYPVHHNNDARCWRFATLHTLRREMHFAVFACISVRRAHFGALHVMHPLCIGRTSDETSGNLHLDNAGEALLLLTAFCMRHENRHRRPSGEMT